MRALWKELALRWLGGDASEALAGDSRFFDSLIDGEDPASADPFRITHEPAVSRRPNASSPEPAPTPEEAPVADVSESK